MECQKTNKLSGGQEVTCVYLYQCVSVELQAQTSPRKKSLPLLIQLLNYALKQPEDSRSVCRWNLSRYNVICTDVYSSLFMVSQSGTTLKFCS